MKAEDLCIIMLCIIQMINLLNFARLRKRISALEEAIEYKWRI